MQPPLSYREVCSLPPACPPSPLLFHLHTPMHHPNCREVFGRVPSPGFPALMPTVPWQDSPQRSWHTGTPGSCHAPPAPAALSITQPGQGAGGGTPKVVGVGRGGHPPLGFAPQHGACQGGGHLRNAAPSAVTRRIAGSRRWHGDKPGREVAPQHLREGNNPWAFLFWQAPGAPLSAPPVLLPRSGAGTQLNQCSANNLPANKTFSSLSLLPPTPPQSVCDGSALI